MHVWVLFINAGFHKVFGELKAVTDYAQARYPNSELTWLAPTWVKDGKMVVTTAPDGTNFNATKRKVH